MTQTPTLNPHRLDQLRVFLTAEAAAQAAGSQRRTLVGSRGRRLVVGTVAAMALGGVFAVSTLRPGGIDAALAITTEGEWTTVRLADVDADAQAVVDELVAAGIDARIAPRSSDTNQGYGWTMNIVSDLSPELAYGLSIMLPVEPDPTSRIEPTDEPPPPITGPVEVVPDVTDLFELHGVRTHDDGEDWSFSIQSGSDALVLVHTRQ